MNTDDMGRKGIYYCYRINKERGIQRTGKEAKITKDWRRRKEYSG